MIGGFSLGLERAGMETVAFCESDKNCQLVLKKHWPEIPIYDDIKQLTGKQIAEEIGAIDIITAGVPCQPASFAGKRGGESDDRWLWPEAIRIIREVHPRWCILENVYGFLTLNDGMAFEHVCVALEKEGYEVQAFNIPACAVGRSHKRERVWILAHAMQGLGQVGRDITGMRWEYEQIPEYEMGEDETAPGMVRTFDGIPSGLDRLKQLGNAVVPQVVEVIGRAIMEIEKNQSNDKQEI